jgi:hypothetical protein
MFERANSRPGRRKAFTDGRQDPIDRNDRAKLMHLAELSRRRGAITRAAVDIMRALLFQFANMKDGRCIPSHKRLGEAAGAHERTVGRCLTALEEAGLVGWIHRLRRIKEHVGGALVRRVVRSSNSYSFPPITKTSESPAIHTDGQNRGGTSNPDSSKSFAPAAPIEIDPTTPLGASMLRCREARDRRMQPT